MGKTKRKRHPSQEQKQTNEQVPQRGFKGAHVLAVVNKGQNKRKTTYFHKTKTNRGESAAAWFQECTCFVQWRIRRRRIIWARVWKSPARNIAFFCFPLFFFLLTADTFRDEALAASLSDNWLNHEPLSISARFVFYHDETYWFSLSLVLALF